MTLNRRRDRDHPITHYGVASLGTKAHVSSRRDRYKAICGAVLTFLYKGVVLAKSTMPADGLCEACCKMGGAWIRTEWDAAPGTFPRPEPEDQLRVVREKLIDWERRLSYPEAESWVRNIVAGEIAAAVAEIYLPEVAE